MSDDGTLLVGRAGTSTSGYLGVMWIDGIGWLKWNEFFRKQGVAEAYAVPFDNSVSVSAPGRDIVGGFPNGLRDKVAAGAKVGRCRKSVPGLRVRIPALGDDRSQAVRGTRTRRPGTVLCH